MERLIIIDGNSLINRAFYALPPLTASDGTPSGAVYGFATMLVKLITENKPDYFAVAFDTRAPTFRHKQFDGYKATRKGMPDELAAQLAPLKKMLALMNIRTLECEGFEADDIIGTVAKHCGINCTIVTGDRDSLQLVDDNVSVMLTKRGITEVLLLNKDNFESEIGLKPQQIIDYKALCGDSSDNIPGVAGIGDKTATNLLKQFDTLEGVYQNLDKITGSAKTKLEAGKESAKISKWLATINTDMELDCLVGGYKFDFPFTSEVRDYFTFMGFRSLLKREELFDNSGTTAQVKAPKKEVQTIKIESESELERILSGSFSTLSFFYENSIHFATNDEISYEITTAQDLLGGGIDYNCAIKHFANALQNTSIKKLVFDAKTLKKQLKKQGIDLVSFEDIKLMQYLVDMTIDYSTANTTLAAHGQSGGAASFFDIYSDLKSELERLGMTKLYYEIELPLIDVLFSMEQEGFKTDVDKIYELGKIFSAKMAAETAKIYQLAGIEFNVNSPKQLADVLFVRLQIPYPKKSKTFSTGAEILQEILDQHEIIRPILEYRTYFKLNNTYIEGLKKLAGSDGRIHTEFRQMVTTTGRLSSVEPNLQNIPIRDEEGKVLREIFVSSEGRTLVSADYSQIELRLLAHYSADKKLISAYNNGEDIHTSTAAEVFSVSKEAVTSQMRRDAKAVNFGIIYGMSDFGLAQTLHIPRYKAKSYIEKYFERFASVKEYLNASVASAKKTGYAETLLGRKRKIPELFSQNFNMRGFGERAAMNMPLQGTAADIVKIAMLKVFDALKGKKSKLILQIHDELIIDAADDEIEEVIAILRDNMTGAVSLRVPLEVDVACGKRWSDC